MLKVLQIIFGFITDPFRKVTSHIDSEKITKYTSKRQWLIYVLTLVITIAAAIIFYVVLKDTPTTTTP